METKKGINRWLAIGLSLLVPVIVFGANVTIPNVFSPGTQIRSADMNANFVALRDGVNSKLDVSSAALVGGTRLSVLALHSADGLNMPTGQLFDHTTGTSCTPDMATDGKVRCLPTGLDNTAIFTDPSCTNVAYTPRPPNPSGWPAQTGLFVRSYSFVDGGSFVSVVYTAVPFVGVPYGFGATDAGFGCIPFSPDAGAGTYSIGATVNPTTFVEFTPVSL